LITIVAVFLGWMTAQETGPWTGIITVYLVLHTWVNTILIGQPIYITIQQVDEEGSPIE
jgi:hypothetical protein